MTGAPVNEGKDARPGLAAREAAARLLAAVVDKKVSLDGLTDHANGNPAFLALERRDRELVRAILVTALRFRNTVEALISTRRLSPAASTRVVSWFSTRPLLRRAAIMFVWSAGSA